MLIRSRLTEQFRVESEFPKLGDKIFTDMGTQFGGRGEHMSPTEMLACALGACVLTMMAFAAQELGIDLGGTEAEVTKALAQDPDMRVSRLNMVVRSPATPSEELKAKLEAAAKSCPIHRSLDERVEKAITFEWGV